MTCLLLLLHELLLFSASVVPYACYNGSYKSTVMVILMKKNVPFMMCDKSRTQITVDHGSVQVSNPTFSYVMCIVLVLFIQIKPFNLIFIYGKCIIEIVKSIVSLLDGLASFFTSIFTLLLCSS